MVRRPRRDVREGGGRLVSVNDYRASRILVVVKTYPNPSQKYGETVCCAGVDLESGGWIRMYPITFRRLAARFQKFQIITCRAALPKGDLRPESRRIDQDSISPGVVIPPRGRWRERLALLPPLSASMEEIHELNVAQDVSIAAFRPARIKRLLIRPAEPWTERQLGALRQERMKLGEDDSPTLRELEQLPFEFSYEYACFGERCRGHTMRILDWEIGAAYRSWSRSYPNDWEERIRDKFERELPGKDLILVVGTMAAHPKTFVIIGLIYPPRPKVDGGMAIQQTLDLVGQQRPVTRRRILLETEQAHPLGPDERQESLDLLANLDEPLPIPGAEGLPVSDQLTKRSRRAKRRKGQVGDPHGTER